MNILKTFLLLLVLPLCTMAQQPDETELVRAAVNEYIEGRNNGEPDRLRAAFLPTASLKGVSRDKDQTVASIADYIAKQTPGKKQQCLSEIRFIDFKNDVAVAQVVLTYPTFSYYDYLVLMKIKDKWIIADKIYTRVEKSSH